MPASGAARAERGSRGALGRHSPLIAVIGLAPHDRGVGRLSSWRIQLANVAGAIAGVVYATLGALIVRRARNLIRLAASRRWPGVRDAVRDRRVRGPRDRDVSEKLVPCPQTSSGRCARVGLRGDQLHRLAFMLLFFPTGTLPSPRWRPIPLLIGMRRDRADVDAGSSSARCPLALPAPGGAPLLRVPNPLGIESFGEPNSRPALVATVWTVVLTMFGAAFGALQVAGYRALLGTASSANRSKWVAFVAALALLANLRRDRRPWSAAAIPPGRDRHARPRRSSWAFLKRHAGGTF